MDLATIVADIQDEINKGSAITDAQVRTKVRDALNFLELSHSWASMDRFVTFTLDTGATEPRAIATPTGLKSMEFIRLDTSEDFQYLNEVKAMDVTNWDAGLPVAYWKDGMEYFWLDRIPGENYTGAMSYTQFTTWSADDAFEPWLFQVAGTLIKYQALMFMGIFLREPELGAAYKIMRDEQLKAALDMNEELEYRNQAMRMGFS